MPLPKKRHSSTRGKKRRTHWKISAENLVPCPQCKTLKIAHRVCPVCGTYAGRQVIAIKTKAEKKKKDSK
jgi:large subunit ribosomal protein L32